MKDGIIRKRFNNAVKEQSALPEGKNTLRILGALKEVTQALRDEGFDARLSTRYGTTGLDDSFSEENTDRAHANGDVKLSGETLNFMLWDDGYEGGDMYFRINWQGANIITVTSTWDDNKRRWDDSFENQYDEEEDQEDSDWDAEEQEDSAPAKPAKKVTLEGKIADALIEVLAKVDLAQRHTVTGEEELDKTFRVPAQIKLAPPKGTP
ncbi:MAG: hypothetical protein ACAH80_05655 [Alphaproteobacteria bacterium]